jgi:23S rRNA (cytosine1962-C5)-methyltransferase
MATRADDLRSRLDAALARRESLLSDPTTNVGRMVNGPADHIPGLVIDRLGEVLIAQLYEGQLTASETALRDLCGHAATRLGAAAVYRKRFPRDRTGPRAAEQPEHRDPQPWIGTPSEPEIQVREAGVTFLVRPYDGFATGLYLDHRRRREDMRELAAGRRVLNAFAYTCGFTVAAGLGGATSTVSVDISKRHLEWGKRNLTANGLALDAHRFICSDLFDYYRRAQRQKQRFDLILLDPPTFARMRRPRRTFSLAADLERLIDGAVDLLDAEGRLHVSVNHRGTTPRKLQEALHGAASRRGRRYEILKSPPPPADCAGSVYDDKSLIALVL